jgi:dCMP deaminase
MKWAHDASLRSTCRRLAVGAVLVFDERPVGMGYNGAPAGLPHCIDVGCLIGEGGGCKRSNHAEKNLFDFLHSKNIDPAGGTIYLTHSPCIDCSRLIVEASVSKVIYDSLYRDQLGLRYLLENGVHVEQFYHD